MHFIARNCRCRQRDDQPIMRKSSKTKDEKRQAKKLKLQQKLKDKSK